MNSKEAKKILGKITRDAATVEKKLFCLSLLKAGYMSAKQAGKVLSELGSAKGGRVRAERLTPERRSEIARKAAQARWSKNRTQFWPEHKKIKLPDKPEHFDILESTRKNR